MLRSSLFNCSDACIRASGTITVAILAVGGVNNNIQVVFKNYATFTNCIREIPMYNLIEHSDNYSKISGSSNNTIEMNQL